MAVGEQVEVFDSIDRFVESEWVIAAVAGPVAPRLSLNPASGGAHAPVPGEMVVDYVDDWIRSVEGHGEQNARAVLAVQHMGFYQRLQRFVVGQSR